MHIRSVWWPERRIRRRRNRVHGEFGRVRTSGLRRTRRGRKISAARAARRLSEMLELGQTLEVALRRRLTRIPYRR